MSYDIPNWAGRPKQGLHLDVLKEGKLFQKLMIDEKKCYLFGRNTQMNDFCIDHASCSRVHAAFVYHKHLNIAYLVDLGSTHGTYIGNLRLEAHKPTQLQINSNFHFGASTRQYILRERPTNSRSVNIMEDIPMGENAEVLGLPESQTELDNLTEYNTAHNRRISLLGIADDFKKNAKPKRKRRGVTFNEEDLIINPEDVDPSVGRFRNLIHTTIVPTKRMKMENSLGIPTSSPSTSAETMRLINPTSLIPHLYQGLLPPSDLSKSGGSESNMDIENVGSSSTSLGSKFGIILPNPAPEVLPTEAITPTVQFQPNLSSGSVSDEGGEDVPKKKKYAKEQWPGRKPLLSGL